MSSRYWDMTGGDRVVDDDRPALPEPMYTYETMMYGQLVTVKRYPPGPKPKTLDAAPRQARTLFRIVPEHKDSQQGTADKWLPAAEKAEGDKNETDYAAIRAMPPIDGRREKWRDEDYLGRRGGELESAEEDSGTEESDYSHDAWLTGEHGKEGA